VGIYHIIAVNQNALTPNGSSCLTKQIVVGVFMIANKKAYKDIVGWLYHYDRIMASRNNIVTTVQWQAQHTQ